MKTPDAIDRTPKKMRDTILIVGWMTLIFASCVAALNNWGAGAFSPDSWAYFELSETIWSDFYRIQHFRSYWTGDYSAAFPPLWPALIFIANGLFNLGPDVAIVLNMIILLLIAAVAESITKATFDVRGPGVLMALVLMLHPGFFSELVAGRSIPLFVLLGLTALRLMIVQDSTHTALRFGALGVVLAAMCMTRFDGAPWVLILFPIVLTLKPGPRGVLAFCATFTAGVAPWIAYSIERFGVVFVSDNSWVARALDPYAFVTDFPPAQGSTISDDPASAIETVIGRVPDLLSAAAISPGRLGVFVFSVFLIILFCSAPWRRIPVAVSSSGRALPFIAVGLAIASASPGYLLTGYFDGRYFSFHFAFAVLLVLVGIWTGARARMLARVAVLVVSIAAVSIALFLAPGRSSVPQIGLLHESKLAECLGLEPNHAPILVANATQAARIAALHGVRTAFIPENFRRGASDQALHEVFLNSYRIEYALDANEQVATVFGGERLSSITGCGLNLSRILPREAPSHIK